MRPSDGPNTRKRRWQQHEAKLLSQTERWKPIVLKQNLEGELTEKAEWQGDRWGKGPLKRTECRRRGCSGSRTCHAPLLRWQNSQQSPRNTHKMKLRELGVSSRVLRDYLPKNGVHVLEFSFHNKVIIIGGGRGAGVRLRGYGRGEGHIETSSIIITERWTWEEKSLSWSHLC